jgi:glycosyltransferase involved in cell wall biosynthesis
MSELRSLRIVQMGPGLSVRGGVSSVERLIVEKLHRRIPVRHIATMEDGSPWKKLRVFVRAVFQLRRELARPEPLLVHIHFASRGSTLRKLILAKMILRSGWPLVLHAHGASFDQFFGGLVMPLQSLVKKMLRSADRLIVLSSQWRTFYTRCCEVPAQGVTVLHNPVELPEAVPDRSGRARVQFLFLGRIGQRKGAFDLLQAFGALAPELRARARLVMAGDGEVEALRNAAARYGDLVSVLSWVDTARRETLLRESDVFVLPSYSEGVPMAIMEAMATGLPLIVSPVGGIPDVVTDCKEGLLVKPGDLTALTRALGTLILDEPQRLACGREARTRALDFDAGRYVDSLLQLYQQIAGERASARAQQIPGPASAVSTQQVTHHANGITDV